MSALSKRSLIKQSLINIGATYALLLPLSTLAAEQTATPIKEPTPTLPTASQDENLLSVLSQTEHLKRLSQHPQWHHLLFYKAGKAEVISPNFYLSDPTAERRHRFDPYQELILTLQQGENEQVRCRYPARYFWLNRQLAEVYPDEWSDWSYDLSVCKDLPDPNQQVSLLMVSSYLKNPASTFGHVLIKSSSTAQEQLDTDADADANTPYPNGIGEVSDSDLLDQSYNFGARIPENENGFLYAFKGLFGLYDAKFSAGEYFRQDAVYAQNEQRDMWEYMLNLDEFNTRLLNYHLYELQSARFTYYFIKQNCGYRSGELLELVSDIKTTNRLGGWYAPEFEFDQLVEHDQALRQQGNTGLIKAVRYLPSEQTKLRQRFEQLPKQTKRLVNEFIKRPDMSVLSPLSEEQQAMATEFLLTHRNYRLSQANDDKKEHHQRIKAQLIAHRFGLPAGNQLSQLPLTYKPSPATSNKTTQTQLTISDKAVEVGLSLFVKDPLNTHTDLNKRFEAVNIQLQHDYDGNQPLLKSLTLLNMQQIENVKEPLAGEPKLSWQLKAGVTQDVFDPDKHMSYAQAGVGAGVQLTPNLLGYGLVSAQMHDQTGHVDAISQLGIRGKRQGTAAQLEYTVQKRQKNELHQQTHLTLRQQLNKNNDLRLHLDYLDNPNSSDEQSDFGVGISYHHYW